MCLSQRKRGCKCYSLVTRLHTRQQRRRYRARRKRIKISHKHRPLNELAGVNRDAERGISDSRDETRGRVVGKLLVAVHRVACIEIEVVARAEIRAAEADVEAVTVAIVEKPLAPAVIRKLLVGVAWKAREQDQGKKKLW